MQCLSPPSLILQHLKAGHIPICIFRWPYQIFQSKEVATYMRLTKNIFLLIIIFILCTDKAHSLSSDDLLLMLPAIIGNKRITYYTNPQDDRIAEISMNGGTKNIIYKGDKNSTGEAQDITSYIYTETIKDQIFSASYKYTTINSIKYIDTIEFSTGEILKFNRFTNSTVSSVVYYNQTQSIQIPVVQESNVKFNFASKYLFPMPSQQTATRRVIDTNNSATNQASFIYERERASIDSMQITLAPTMCDSQIKTWGCIKVWQTGVKSNHKIAEACGTTPISVLIPNYPADMTADKFKKACFGFVDSMEIPCIVIDNISPELLENIYFVASFYFPAKIPLGILLNSLIGAKLLCGGGANFICSQATSLLDSYIETKYSISIQAKNPIVSSENYEETIIIERNTPSFTVAPVFSPSPRVDITINPITPGYMQPYEVTGDFYCCELGSILKISVTNITDDSYAQICSYSKPPTSCTLVVPASNSTLDTLTFSVNDDILAIRNLFR